MLHDNYLGPISSDNAAGVRERGGEHCAEECEDDESSVGAVSDGASRVVDILAEGNLR